MGLQSAFDSLLSSEDPLSQINAMIWQSLAAGAASPKHPWHEGAFSTITVDPSGQVHPRTRTVILRSVDLKRRTIDFFTDARSAKVDQLQHPSVAWLFYASASKIQLRLQGSAMVIGGEEADAAWEQTSLASRSAYLSMTHPGNPSDSLQPPDTSDRNVSLAVSERGRVNFRIVQTTVETVDWLYLRRQGHVRARLDYRNEERVHASWLVP